MQAQVLAASVPILLHLLVEELLQVLGRSKPVRVAVEDFESVPQGLLVAEVGNLPVLLH